jgi:hypothetical protein
MKKYIITLLFCTLFCHPGIAQGLKSVSILGDSYSTFEGYVQPDTNFVWYLKTPPKGRKTDMVLYVIPGGISLLRRTTTVFV